jgi:putative nucleotidyltransferase with HDIG domain
MEPLYTSQAAIKRKVIMRTQHLAAGNIYVGKTQPLKLQALLGSCVGVVLYDTAAGIGGMIHILLPEPSSTSLGNPEKYASTGMPRLLQLIYAHGARPESVKAVMAGGGLIGSIDELDMQLDIGGRTAEIVNGILASENIMCEKFETGGCFPYRLTLDMQSWCVEISLLGRGQYPSAGETSPPSPEQIHAAIEGLAPIPQVALKICRMIEGDQYDIDELAEEVRKDQVIAARTLQICNSAMFARRFKIESLERALNYLGQQQFLHLVIVAAVEKFFNQSCDSYSLCKGGLFHHAVGTALVAEKLACSIEGASASKAYTFGLLHDIGMVVLDQFVGQTSPFFYRQLQDKPNLMEVEEEVLGISHPAAGGLLADKWSFPESLADVIRWHHQPERSQTNGVLTHIIHVADVIMSRFHVGLNIEGINSGPIAPRLGAIGLSSDKFHDFIETLPSELFAALPGRIE